MTFEEFPNAHKWQRPLDPSARVPYVCHFRHPTNPTLEPLESIDTFEIIPSANALLQGLVVGSGAYAPVKYDNASGIKLWLEVDPLKADNVLFSCDGIWLPVTIRVVTDATPANTYEATCAVRVVQQ